VSKQEEVIPLYSSNLDMWTELVMLLVKAGFCVSHGISQGPGWMLDIENDLTLQAEQHAGEDYLLLSLFVHEDMRLSSYIYYDGYTAELTVDADPAADVRDLLAIAFSESNNHIKYGNTGVGAFWEEFFTWPLV
jgi:hypothetical protein